MKVHLSAERQAQLNDYAQRHGQDPAAALDEVLADALEWELLDFQEAVEGIREGYEDLRAGRTRPADEMFEELLTKYGPALRLNPLPSTADTSGTTHPESP